MLVLSVNIGVQNKQNKKKNERSDKNKMAQRLVTFSAAGDTCSLRLSVGRGACERDKQLLRMFYRAVKNVCRRLMEFSARRFGSSDEDRDWQFQCSLVRNELLHSTFLAGLACQMDEVLNWYDRLLERPDLTYDSGRCSSCFGWLQEVKKFFTHVSLLLTVCVRWLSAPARLAEQCTGSRVAVAKEDLVHSTLFDDFVNSYFRRVVFYPLGGPLPASLQHGF